MILLLFLVVGVFLNPLAGVAQAEQLPLSGAQQQQVYLSAQTYRDTDLPALARDAGAGERLERLIIIDARQGAAESIQRVLRDLGGFETEPRVVRSYAAAVECGVLVRLGRRKDAESLCQEARAEVDGNPQWRDSHRFLVTRILYLNSFLAMRRGEVLESLRLANDALPVALELDSVLFEAQLRSARALAFHHTGLAAAAIGEFERALVLTRGAGSEGLGGDLERVVSFNLGLAYLDNGQHEEALTRFTQAVRWASAEGQSHRELIARTYAAQALFESGDAVSSLSELRAYLAANEERTFDPDSKAHALLVCGRIEASNGDLAAALEEFDRGLELAADIPLRRRELLLARARTLTALQRLPEARTDVERLLAESTVEEALAVRSDALLLKARLEAARDNWVQAYGLREEASQLQERSRLRDSAVRTELLAAEMAAEARQGELTRALAEEASLRERVRQNNMFWGAGFVAMALLGLVAYLVHSRSQQRGHSEQLQSLVVQRSADLEREVAHRMRSEEERRLLELQVAESDKLRALGQITGGVAHDFNNLLTVMMSAAEMLRIGPGDDEERTELADSIVQAAEAGRDITRDLLVYARRERLQPEVVRLDQHLLGLRDMLRRAAGETVTVTIEARPALAQLDPGHLTSAVINLVRNAADAGGSGSRVLVEVDVDAPVDDATGGDAMTGGDGIARVSVSDHGIGMSEEQIQRACEPFYSTKKTAMASGLGLSMVYGFVNQSGGEFEIRSELGKGTTVVMRFPLLADGTAVPVATEEELVPAGLRVLLVDDSDPVRRVVGALLRSLSLEVVDVAGVSEAVEIFRSRQVGAPFDLLVSDVLMPGGRSGVDLARDLRGLAPELPVLLISGYPGEDLNGFPFLSKPFDRTQLVRSLRAALGLGSETRSAQLPADSDGAGGLSALPS